jgi:hypothetical protein
MCRQGSQGILRGGLGAKDAALFAFSKAAQRGKLTLYLMLQRPDRLTLVDSELIHKTNRKWTSGLFQNARNPTGKTLAMEVLEMWAWKGTVRRFVHSQVG